MNIFVTIYHWLFDPLPQVGETYVNADEADNPFCEEPEEIEILSVEKGWVKFRYTNGFRAGRVDSDPARDLLIVYRKAVE